VDLCNLQGFRESLQQRHVPYCGSYVFCRDVLLPGAADANDTTAIPWADVRGDIVPKADMITVMLPAKDNKVSKWRVYASTGKAVSASVLQAKAADGIEVAGLIDGAEKAADITVSAFSNVAEGGAVDNIAPAAFAGFSVATNPQGSGVLVSWVVPTTVELKYQHGVVGSYTLMDQEIPIYGVEAYDIYRKTGTADFAKVGTAGPGALSFVDNVTGGATVYQYYVKALDDVPEHAVMTSTRSTISTTALRGDFDGNSNVGAADFSIFAANYGKTRAANEVAWVASYDLNNDGKIDASDFSIFAASYGSTLKLAKAAAAGMPTSDIPMSLSANVDESTSMYFINVSFDKSESLKGFELYLSYNNDALEFVENSVSGLVGLNMTNVVEDGIIRVADWFVGEQFDGTVTLGFRSKGMNSNLDFEIVNAMIDDVAGLSVTTNVSDLSVKALPTVYALSQNYPNPFNPTTTIDYSIPKSGNVEIAIFNIAGQKVRTLVSQKQDAGFYKVVWDGHNDTGESVASGLYFYRLVSGSFSNIEKMTLVK